jgi:hypothetical protein
MITSSNTPSPSSFSPLSPYIYGLYGGSSNLTVPIHLYACLPSRLISVKLVFTPEARTIFGLKRTASLPISTVVYDVLL